MSLSRTSLRAQIKNILLARILNGEYAPGYRLIELQIAQEFGTSQAPVRESLRELEALGFVESTPYRGTRVRNVTQTELIETYLVRAALEEVAARAAASYFKDNVGELELKLAAMQREADNGDLYALVRHDFEFQSLIVEASANKVLQDVWKSLRIETHVLISAMTIKIDPHEVVEMHRPLIAALAAGDGERAGTIIRQHLEHLGELIMQEK